MTTTPPRIGFIGLGIMGAPMAGHLLRAGHPLHVHTRSRVPESAVRRPRAVFGRGHVVAHGDVHGAGGVEHQDQLVL